MSFTAASRGILELGGRLPPSPALWSLLLFLSRLCVPVPSWRSAVAFCSFSLNRPDGADVAGGPSATVHRAKSAWMGARCQARDQQTPPSPSLYSPSETWVYKFRHDKSPGNFLCRWQLHTHAFPFSCKKIHSQLESRQKVSHATPTAHRRCIFRKVFSPLKFSSWGTSPPCPCTAWQELSL